MARSGTIRQAIVDGVERWLAVEDDPTAQPTRDASDHYAAVSDRVRYLEAAPEVERASAGGVTTMVVRGEADGHLVEVRIVAPAGAGGPDRSNPSVRAKLLQVARRAWLEYRRGD